MQNTVARIPIFAVKTARARPLTALAALLLLLGVPLSCFFPLRLTLPLSPRGMTLDEGFSWFYTLDDQVPQGEGGQYSSHSSLLLYENGRLLGPPYSMHQAIRRQGHGRFSHWGRALYFSSSDNTSPRANGRVYSIAWSARVTAWVIAAALILAALEAAIRAARRKRLRGRFVSAGITALGVILILAVLELAAGMAVQPAGKQFAKSFRLNHTFTPNTFRLHEEFAKDNPGFPQPFLHVYNSQGWLMPRDIPIKKPAGTFRIFYVGDSFTEGLVPMPLSVPSLVQKGLKAAFKGRSCSFEVINTGTSSYSTLIYYTLIRYTLARYQPDLVVLCFDMTDVRDDAAYRQNLIQDADGNPWAVLPRGIFTRKNVMTENGLKKAGPWTRIQLFLYTYSRLYNLILLWFGPQASDGGNMKPHDAWCAGAWSPETRQDVLFSMDILRRIIVFCQSQNIKIIITGVPHYEQMTGAWPCRPHAELEKTARAGGALYLDSAGALKPLIQNTPHDYYYYNHDMHFNPRGNALWARAHLDFLLQNSPALFGGCAR